MQSTADELMQKTRAYWFLSSVWNGRIDKIVQTGEAIDACSTMMMRTNCERPLSRSLFTLQGELIEGEGRVIKHQSKIIPFKERA
jgi:hypothetical protein